MMGQEAKTPELKKWLVGRIQSERRAGQYHTVKPGAAPFLALDILIAQCEERYLLNLKNLG